MNLDKIPKKESRTWHTVYMSARTLGRFRATAHKLNVSLNALISAILDDAAQEKPLGPSTEQTSASKPTEYPE